MAVVVASLVLAVGCTPIVEGEASSGRDVPVLSYDDDDVAAALEAMERDETPDELSFGEPSASPNATVEPPAEDDEDDEANEGWVIVTDAPLGLNVRSGPGTDFDVVAQIETGTVVAATGAIHEATGWVEVALGDASGWVTPGYVQATAPPAANTAFGSATPTPLPTPTPLVAPILEVSGVPLGLNLRSGPATTYPVVSEIETGSIVVTSGRTRSTDDGEWTEIEHNGLTGWVYSAFLIPTD